MRIWIEEYGRTTVAVFCCLCLCGILFFGFLSRWREAGGVSDRIKTNFKANEPGRTAPVLRITDFKVRKGEEVNFTPYVSAVDFDGKEISGQIEIAEGGSRKTEGKPVLYQNMVTGWNGDRWEEQGIFHFVLKVKSAVTGKVTKGKLVVLVDAPENGEGRDAQ